MFTPKSDRLLETLALAGGETAEADYAAWLAKNSVSA